MAKSVHTAYNGRCQDLAFEKPEGASVERRHHVRFWRDHGQEEGTVWLGTATFDRAVGLTHDQHHVTHQIAPDIDAECDLLTTHLKAANVVEIIYQVTGIGPTLYGHNGEDEVYYTDGDVKISFLVGSCKSARRDDRRSPTDPPLLAIKSLAWMRSRKQS